MRLVKPYNLHASGIVSYLAESKKFTVFGSSCVKVRDDSFNNIHLIRLNIGDFNSVGPVFISTRKIKKKILRCVNAKIFQPGQMPGSSAQNVF
jgi:hypothetical protein